MSFLQGLPVLDPEAFTDMDPQAMESPSPHVYSAQLSRQRPVSIRAPHERLDIDAFGADYHVARSVDESASYQAQESEPPAKRASTLVRRFYALAARRDEARKTRKDEQSKRQAPSNNSEEQEHQENTRKRMRWSMPLQGWVL